MSARVVDALGTWCPVPIHLIARAASGASDGEELALLADDPLIAVDLPAWCHSTGNELTALRRDGEGWIGLVTVRTGGSGPRPRD